MTAFARETGAIQGATWAVEVRSINHRFFDFSVKLPPVLNGFEAEIRDLVQAHIRRGKIVVAINRDSEEERLKEVSLNEPAVKLYIEAIAKLKKQFRVSGDITVSDLLKLPGTFTVKVPELNPDKVWLAVQKLMKVVIKQTLKSKEIEGAKLAKDIFARLDAITKVVEKVKRLSEGESERIYKKLTDRIDALLKERDKDPERIQREVAFLADRSDITEEIVRLNSHLELFKNRLKADGELGRELDFLCQEMNREINTIGSKSQLFDISKEVVFVKGELEKIREQIQNIE